MIIVFEANEQKSVVFSELMEVLERHSELEFLYLKHELPLSLGGLEIDPAHRKIHYNSKEISLTTKEYDLLYLLAANKGYILTYDQIYQKVWKEEAFGTANNAIACHILRPSIWIFKKIQIDWRKLQCLKSIQTEKRTSIIRTL